jgi:hypothetical protein
MLLRSSLARKFRVMRSQLSNQKGGKQRIIYLELDCLVALWSEVHYPKRIGQLSRARLHAWTPQANKLQKIHNLLCI